MRSFFLSFLFLLALFSLFSFTAFSKGIVVDKIVATVEGQPITAYELENISGFYNSKSTKELVNRVIDDYVVMYYAKKMGIVVTDDDINRYINNMANSNGMSEDAFLQKIKEQGIDLDYYKKGVELSLYKRKFALRMFAPTIHITEADIERYYNLHKGEFKANPVLVMSIISVRDKDLAYSIYKKLQQGGNFESLKEKFSMDKEPERAIPLSAFNRTIRSKLAALKVGGISDIIEADNVYYIVKLINKKGEKVSLNSLKDRIRNMLFEQRVKAKLASWIKMVKTRTDIEIFE